jgi:hypothetical protein
VKVPDSKGLANRTVPESCVRCRETRHEALTGVHVGQPLSRETYILRGADAVPQAEGITGGCAIASARLAPRGRKTLACM